ncbi:MAG TPA: patatin-like phospholipase family protein [Thermoanaerobaculia bacterium]|nr:patatin-like phospholipase family protein [Thermoanaerobaculia bacterium]
MPAIELKDVLRDEYERLHRKPLAATKIDEVFEELHGHGQTALCISGGGIRSATFALGVIQCLARIRCSGVSLLEKFDYLSTVSGGGYVGSWLSAYARRTNNGIAAVAQEIAERRQPPSEPESEPLRHLRSYSNYLTPRLGLLSADTWALVGTYLRNLSLTWLILIPLFIALLAIPRLFVALIRTPPPRPIQISVGALMAILFALGIGYIMSSRPVGRGTLEDGRKHTNGRFLWRTLLPLTLCSLCVVLLFAWQRTTSLAWELAFVAGLLNALFTTFYMHRYRAANADEQREDVRPGVSKSTYTWKKQSLETALSAIAGAIFTGGAYMALGQLFPPDFMLPPALPQLADWLNPASIPSPHLINYACFGVALVNLAFLIAATIFIGGTSWYNEDYDREWWARAGGWLLIGSFGWIAISFLSLYGPVLIYYAPRTITGVGMITGGFALLMGKSDKTAANRKEKEEQGLLGKSLNISMGLAVPIFIICLFAGLSLATTKVLGRKIGGLKPIANAALLERSAWSVQQKAGIVAPLGGDLTVKTSEFPVLEADTLAARAHLYIVGKTPAWVALAVVLIGALAGSVASFFIGVNQFSMHALYRNRLVRAYLGASNRKRVANYFTGFDPEDNLRLEELRPDFVLHEEIGPGAENALKSATSGALFLLHRQLSKETSSKTGEPFRSALADELSAKIKALPLAQRLEKREQYETTLGEHLHGTNVRPFHIINMAWNLVSGEQLAWQERKAESFTASSLHCGSWRHGYRPSDEYGGPRGMSLGTAVTISGAAASPNQGYHSSPALALLMTFFNVRLGWWLGNPSNAGEKTYTFSNPRWSLRPLLAEAFGLTNSSHPYIYCSDGGHFENLGLYEMVLRRCRSILVIDAGQDDRFIFDDLGNAIRKIRIDFGIDITIDKMGLFPRRDQKDPVPANAKYGAVGTIRYHPKDRTKDGHFVYLKPVFYGKNEPKDVYNYATMNRQFPHEPTLGDQFFSESQFESYRRLGEHALDEICRDKAPPSIAALIAAAQDYVNGDDEAPGRSDPGRKLP